MGQAFQPASHRHRTCNYFSENLYHVLDVLVDGNSVGAVTTYTFSSVTANHTIAASFEANDLMVVQPNGGEIWKQGAKERILWTYKDKPGKDVRIELLKGGTVALTIAKKASIGKKGNGSIRWKIPKSLAPGNDYRIRITSTTVSSITDTSDNNFEILARE